MAHRVKTDEVCVNCGACDPTCPVDAISEQNGIRYIDPEKCTDCAACVDACPMDAIVPA